MNKIIVRCAAVVRRALASAVALASLLLLAAVMVRSLWADDGELLEQRRSMIARVDHWIERDWEAAGVKPAVRSQDAEFLRRVYLDLTGVVPRVAEAREFLADNDPDKRSRLIDKLLDSPGHATHMANLWRSMMIPGGLEVEQFQNIAGVQNWLRAQFVDNLRYDRLVSDFLVATGGGDAGPALYFTSLELKPEKLAGSTARMFLGLQIECAECHDHPFDHWKQRDFWGYAAYFARLRQTNRPTPNMQTVGLSDLDTGEVTLPGTDERVPPRFPGAEVASSDEAGARRVQLAIWMASRDNPFLARAAVNRVWAMLFGRGLVDPVDDLSSRNPPSHPELFDELSRYLTRTGFDLRELLRTLTNTRAYQRSSQVEGSPPAPEQFAAMAVKTLSAEQLYDCLTRVSGRRLGAVNTPFGVAAGRLFDQQRLTFVNKMEAKGRSALEYHAGVPQSLTLMNGEEVAALTDPAQSSLLRALDSDLFDAPSRVETLFLATLSRFPDPGERQAFAQHLSEHSENPKQALGDLLWALVNSAEFVLNH